jgi:Ca2+-binding EF-hand superfamily protein
MGKALSKSKKDATTLNEDNITMLLNNTKYSREQIQQWHAGFLKDCPKGLLDKKKFTEVYKEFYPQGKADKFCAQVFNVFDTDHSGKIDFIEFLIAISVSTQGDTQKKLRLAFQMCKKIRRKKTTLIHISISIFINNYHR